MSLAKRIDQYLAEAEWRTYDDRELAEALRPFGTTDLAVFYSLYQGWTRELLPLDQMEEFGRLAAPRWSVIFGESEGTEARLLQYLVEEIQTWMREHPDRAPRVVDAGCGIGLHTAFLAREFPQANFMVYDRSGAFMAEAERRIGDLPNVDLYCGNHDAFSMNLRPIAHILLTLRSSGISLPCCAQNSNGHWNLDTIRAMQEEYQIGFNYLGADGRHILAQYFNDYALGCLDDMLEELGYQRQRHLYLSPHGEDKTCHIDDPIRTGIVSYAQS